MKRTLILLMLITLSIAPISVLSKDQDELPEYTVEGLKRVPNPHSPDTMRAGRSATFVSHAGSMTLYLELYDSETGDLLAKALDPRKDYDKAYMQWQTGPANKSAGKRMMKPWAQALRDALDRAHKETGESP